MQFEAHSTTAPRIDAHHHLWRHTAEEFEWLDGPLAALRRDFTVSDLLEALSTARVDGTVVVQARQTIAETEWLLSLTKTAPAILGVVGWMPIASPDFEKLLERQKENSRLKGLRHVVQAEQDGFLDDPAFNRGIARLRTAGLVYDLLIAERQLAEAIRFVDRHPLQPFVLNHAAKPRIAAGEMEPWRTWIRELARRPNVTCKLSGMVTEADPHGWTETQLWPFAELVLEAFSPDRVMIGTDWPVLTAVCSYGQWWQLIEKWTSGLSTTERKKILGGTAAAIYGLRTPAAHATTTASLALQREPA